MLRCSPTAPQRGELPGNGMMGLSTSQGSPWVSVPTRGSCLQELEWFLHNAGLRVGCGVLFQISNASPSEKESEHERVSVHPASSTIPWLPVPMDMETDIHTWSLGGAVYDEAAGTREGGQLWAGG